MASANLHVHRTTLYYRLSRISDVTGLYLRSRRPSRKGPP
ncbi:helix-turn-helix domain-containing protein [Mycolicibacterium brumae]|uniref:PucR family transcriptional regulator n=1 Tax=Mycolicibacterium brumae TaxID=85968 RepID=A0A2G5PEN1_9MYCO|nr:helix-turn-helix domain-containing protein [Mycolicibacterium brumae]PIB76769.1 PucR family transcriptional regulator [Mycolicibacterium brumae]